MLLGARELWSRLSDELVTITHILTLFFAADGTDDTEIFTVH